MHLSTVEDLFWRRYVYFEASGVLLFLV